MNNIELSNAIHSLAPIARFRIEGEQIWANVEWLDDTPPDLSQAQVQAELERLQAQELANQHQSIRRKEYPSIGDQLDALFHAGVFPAEMAAKIQAVKDKYPKP
jgi:hypothetical protein